MSCNNIDLCVILNKFSSCFVLDIPYKRICKIFLCGSYTRTRTCNKPIIRGAGEGCLVPRMYLASNGKRHKNRGKRLVCDRNSQMRFFSHCWMCFFVLLSVHYISSTIFLLCPFKPRSSHSKLCMLSLIIHVFGLLTLLLLQKRIMLFLFKCHAT